MASVRNTPHHGDREQLNTGVTVSERVWFQPDEALPGRWVTPAEWEGIHSGNLRTVTQQAAQPQTGAAIAGYRTLSDDEKAMMNQMKSTSRAFLAQLEVLQKYLDHQRREANGNPQELARINDACPQKWLAKATTSMQEACMFACRAVAQPSGDS